MLLGGGAACALDPALGVRVVGHATLRDPALLGGTFDPGPDVAILAVDGVAAADLIEPLGLVQRSYGWLAPLPADATRLAHVPRTLAGLAAASDRAARSGLALTAPDDQLRVAAAAARTSARRLALVVGQAAALLLGFAGVAAFALRRGHRAALDVLLDRGASRLAGAAFTGSEAVLAVLPGVAAGLALGLGAVAVLAHETDVATASVARDALGGGTARWAALAVLATAALVAIVLRLPDRRPASGLRPGDVAGLAAAGAALLASARGSASAAGLAERGDPLLALLPALVLGATAVLASASRRRSCARPRVRRRPACRSSASPSGRWPGRGPRALATIAFLAAAGGVTVLALAYRETPGRGAREQAAFQVPLDARLRVGLGQLVRPRDLAQPAAAAALVPGATAGDVIRRTATVRIGGTATATAALLGVEPAAIARIAVWRDDLGPPRTRSRASSHPPRPSRSRAVRLPPQARALVLAVDGLGQRLTAGIVVIDADGRPHTIDADGDGAVALPASGGPWRLLGFRVRQSERVAQLEEHHAGEANTAVAAAAGAIRLRGVRAEPGGAVAVDWQRARHGRRRVGAGGRRDGRHARRRAPGLDRAPPRAPGDGRARASRRRRPRDGARRAGRAARPRRRRRRAARAGRRHRRRPSRPSARASPSSTPRSCASRSTPPSPAPARRTRFGSAPRARRTARAGARRTALRRAPGRPARGGRADLRDDPLARAATGLLLGSGLVSSLLAAVALGLAVAATRRDEAATLHALEAEGARPRDLRLVLAVRGAALVACGVPLGAAAGALLAREVARLVAVTAAASTPVPALAAPPALPLGLAAAFVGAALGLVAVAVAAALAFREELPRSGDAALR